MFRSGCKSHQNDPERYQDDLKVVKTELLVQQHQLPAPFLSEVGVKIRH